MQWGEGAAQAGALRPRKLRTPDVRVSVQLAALRGFPTSQSLMLGVIERMWQVRQSAKFCKTAFHPVSHGRLVGMYRVLVTRWTCGALGNVSHAG